MAELASLIDRLMELVGRENVLSDAGELSVFESDGFTIARARPGAVVFARDVEDVRRIVVMVGESGAQIIPRGSGTGLTGGCVAFENGVIVSTARMRRILLIDLENRVAHVEAGVRNGELSDAVGAVCAREMPGAGVLHFAPDPSSQRASTVGGNAATNAGGIHTLKDFVTSNHVLGMEVVTAAGEVLQLGGEGGALDDGPIDLPGLVCGSEGTFGIITSLWVRLTPKANAFRTGIATFSSSDDACRAVRDVIGAGFLPSALEMLDGMMVQTIREAFGFAFSPGTKALLLFELDGIEELLDGELERMVEIMKVHHPIEVESSADAGRRREIWKMRKSAFGAIGRVAHSYCTQDACVPRSMLPQVIEGIGKIGASFGLQISNVFHAGDGNVHPIFLYDDRDAGQIQNVLDAAEAVLKFCIDLGGTLTGEHGVGVEKLHLMPYLFDGATMDQFERIKRAFDPNERINAGKLIPSDKIKVSLKLPGRHVPQ